MRGHARAGRRARSCTPACGGAQVGRVPLLLLDSDVEANGPPERDDHRPALRRRRRAPPAAGAAAGHRRRARGARVLAGSPARPRPRCSTRTRGTPASSGSSGSASSSRGRASRFDEALVGRARRHRLHHPHPGPRRHRPVRRATSSSSTSRPTLLPGRARSSGCSPSAPRPTTAATRRVQHGRDGPAARRSAANGVASCTARSAGEMFGGALAGLRRRRGADHLGHERRARADTWIARELRDLIAGLVGPDDRRRRPPAGRPSRDVGDARALGTQAGPARAARRRRATAAAGARG